MTTSAHQETTSRKASSFTFEGLLGILESSFLNVAIGFLIPIVRMLNITAKESTIPFEKGRAMVPDEANSVLDAIADSMVQMKPFRVVIEGHTDSSGSGRSNVRLSKQRAEAVAQYLRRKTGLPARLFLTKGLGSSHHRGRDRDRRVRGRPS